ncbi:MAG: hypothetical protein JW969_05070 [Spirochaetales bacterium]|nr:hypothetical protein [Spirochaetales bacterium]
MNKTVHNFIISLLFFFSGICNLIYETVWVRMFNLVFGVTVFAVSAVLTSFMFGLAVGGIVSGGITGRLKNPPVLFSLLHGGIGLCAVLMVLVFPLFQGLYLGIHAVFSPNIHVFRIVIFLLSFLLLSLPTILMGATFPVACRIFSGLDEKPGKGIGILYSVNTLGSVAGAVFSVFFLLGFTGMKGTVFTAAFLDLCIGIAAYVILGLPRKAGAEA